MHDASYTFAVSVNNPVPLSGPPVPGLPADAEMGATVRLRAPQRSEDPPLARVFAPRSAQAKGTVPLPLWIHDGPSGGPWCSVRPAAADTYDVHAPDGTPLARITRRPGRVLPWPRRVRWSARLTGAPDTVTGKEGTWYAWLIHTTTAPVWFLFALCMMLYAYFDGTTDDYTFGRPVRTRWRTPRTGLALDYRGLSKVYRCDPHRLDPRIAYALAVLQTYGRER
ncbi:hypothetical protein PV682_20300 [Streptomyces niveiscabiei]|uniref:hypothetical protein n=1 Tax=Streptomyces niveiscabiei TaxID=164115 RepID=UPI0029B7D45D|nr:hypothetical protein [Streptomyces niveiscabiei]MDX3383785.1 hypothetical protein [Streptomyces niveiscabiei]